MKLKTALFALTLFAFTIVQAQVKTTYTLTSESSKKIMESALNYAKDHNAPGGSIAIVDAGGNLLLFQRLDGTFASSAGVSIDKAHTAALFKANTEKFETAVNGGRVALTTVGYNFLKGGMPIVYKGEIIGAIGVSGTASADQDVEVAQAGVNTKLE